MSEKKEVLQSTSEAVSEATVLDDFYPAEIDKELAVRKKILFVTRPLSPPWDEASKNFAYNLAVNVAQINPELEIHLLTKGDLREYNPALPKNIRQHPIYTVAENDITFSQKLRSLFFQWKAKNKFDIVQYFFTPSKLNTWLIKRFLLPRQSKTIQTIPTLREDILTDKEIKKNMFADLLVTYSAYSKNKLKNLGFSNVQHIYPGIDLEKFSPRKKSITLLEKSGLRKNDFVVMFAGEYSRLGGLRDVLESFVRLEKKLPSLRLFLALRIKNEKDARQKKIVKNELKNRNLLAKVVFEDELDYKVADMSELFNLQDLMIYPIHNMNGKFDVPLVIPESMACQKAVVLSDLPLLREFANYDNAVIIKSGDRNELVKVIEELYGNPTERERLANNARRFAQKKFDIKLVAEEYNDIYQRL